MTETPRHVRRRSPGERAGAARLRDFSLLPDPIPFPADLPIVAEKDRIVAAIREHQVVVVTGATGSGKTTQIPKMCLAAGRGRHGLIACTQPRRVAAISVAARLAQELGDSGETLVGYKIRFQDHTRASTLIKFMTDGILLAETAGSPRLEAYDTVIVDEAHERSLNIDFLLGILKRLLPLRPELKVIITSATIDTEKFSRAFADAPVVEVSGRTYPVEVWYRPLDPEKEESGDCTYIDQAVAALIELRRHDRHGDVLVFMPTERDIRETVEAVAGLRLAQLTVLPMFGRLSARDQQRVFEPVAGQKIVIATNVAETSITVPGIRYVVDTGLARLSFYNVRARTHSLPVSPISRSSADQRKGRCGRLAAGICVRLYSEEDYEHRPLYTPPEILRANLAEVILRMAALGLGDPLAFPFVDPPTPRAVKDGYALLQELGALDPARKLTRRGRLMARLPLDPRISRMIIEARDNNCLREITVIASALSIQDPRERPADKEGEADAMHARFLDPTSDCLSFVRLWDGYHEVWEELRSQGRMRKFCKTHFLSFHRMREWRDIHEQIEGVLAEEKGFVPSREPAGYDAVHRAVLAGHLRHIACKKEKNLYVGAQGKKLTIFPGSGQLNKAGPWIVAAELVETTRLYARTVATIKPEWLEPLAGPLCRSVVSGPHWEKRRGQVVASEKVTLFGLIIVAARKIDFGRINREEAREIFIREALVQGELNRPYGFLAHNRDLIAAVEAMEERLRRRHLLVDDQTLYAFYDRRLGDICTQASFDRLLRERGADDFLRMREEDLLAEAPDRERLAQFPEALEVGRARLPLSYSFAPGSEDDGVTVRIPVDFAGSLPAEPFEWLVPGLLAEKVTFLCKGLPKGMRKRLIPMPEAVEKIMTALAPHQGSLYRALANVLFKEFHVRVEPGQWPRQDLPAHLRMRFCLVDRDGKRLATGRSLADLRRFAAPVGEDPRLASLRKRWERIVSGPGEYPESPASIPLPETGHQPAGLAFPGLAEEGDGRVAVRLFPDRESQAAGTRRGLLALFRMAFAQEIKALRKDFAPVPRLWPLYEGLGDFRKVHEAFLGVIMGGIFAVQAGELPPREKFLAAVEELKRGGFQRRAEDLRAGVEEVLQARREVLDALARMAAVHSGPQRAEGRLKELRQALDRLLSPDSLEDLDRQRIARLPRYLKALAIRVERALLSPAKDAGKQAQVQPHEERLAEAEQWQERTSRQRELLSQYAEMVEELRVSLFAPELKTAFPVSEKRLEKKWQEITEG